MNWDFVAAQSTEFIPCDRAQMGKSALPMERSVLFWNPKKCGCQQRNAMNGMGCICEADQTSTVGQFLRLRHSTWKKVYIQFFELLEANAV